MKPGRPLAFGKVGGALFFGLPGNPVSVMVTFYQFVQPALRRMMGETAAAPVRFRVPCTSRLRKRPGRVEFQRGVLAHDETGRLAVRSTGGQGSGILSSMHEANCFIVLPLESEGVDAGSEVDVEPFGGVAGAGPVSASPPAARRAPRRRRSPRRRRPGRRRRPRPGAPA